MTEEEIIESFNCIIASKMREFSNNNYGDLLKCRCIDGKQDDEKEGYVFWCPYFFIRKMHHGNERERYNIFLDDVDSILHMRIFGPNKSISLKKIIISCFDMVSASIEKTEKHIASLSKKYRTDVTRNRELLFLDIFELESDVKEQKKIKGFLMGMCQKLMKMECTMHEVKLIKNVKGEENATD